MNRSRAGQALTGHIYRVLGIFTGTQMLSILCSVVRTKIVALWIGSTGVGFFGLYNAALEMLSSLAQMGLRTSAVRDIAETTDLAARGRVIHAVRRWGMWLGIGGLLLTVIASPLLSFLTFDTAANYSPFLLLAIAVMLGVFTASDQAIMQGTGRLKSLAKASMWATVVSLVLSIPMIWLWRIEAVVPIIVLYSLSLAVATALASRPSSVPVGVKPTVRETIRTGRNFLRLGAYMTVSGFAVWAVSYMLMSWLNARFGTETVGYYQAGNTLVIRYVGILFSAISMEFYPRLASVSHSRRRLEVYVNHEIITILRVGTPLAVVFAFLAPLIVRILYSEEFSVIVPFVTIAMVGVVARAGAWCLSYVLLAKGDGRLFMICEIVSALICLSLSMAGYLIAGIAGFGWAFVAWYCIYFVMMLLICRIRFGITIGRTAAAWLSLSMAGVALAAYVALILW